MMIPELPEYLTSLGGADYKGYIIALFTLSAALSRPFSGKLADTIGRIPVMVFGASVCFILGFLYPAVGTVWAFLLLRFFHGFSTGFKPTGTSAYVADVVPENRRGEAMGLLGVFGSLGNRNDSLSICLFICPPILATVACRIDFSFSLHCRSSSPKARNPQKSSSAKIGNSSSEVLFSDLNKSFTAEEKLPVTSKGSPFNSLL